MTLNARSSVLLAFLASDRAPLSPIRIMKGLFLIAQRAPESLPRTARYDFIAYDYGPCSFEIYRDLATLVEEGYVSDVDVPGVSWKEYLTTATGTTAAAEASRALDQTTINYIQRVRRFVGSLQFGDLLRRVYEAYPEYAVNSVFRS